MRCEQFQLWMIETLDGTLDATARQQLADHLSVCPRCRADWEALHAVEQLFTHVPSASPAPGFVERVEARIAHFEAQRRTLIGGLVLLGAAAALCLAAAMPWLRGNNPVENYATFVETVYSLAGRAVWLWGRLLWAAWQTLEIMSENTNIPLTSFLTWGVGAVLAAAAWRRSLTRPRKLPSSRPVR